MIASDFTIPRIGAPILHHKELGSAGSLAFVAGIGERYLDLLVCPAGASPRLVSPVRSLAEALAAGDGEARPGCGFWSLSPAAREIAKLLSVPASPNDAL